MSEIKASNCPFCFREHEPQPYRCSSCGQTFVCATQVSMAFGIWAHRRVMGSNLVFGPNGEGPWSEGGEEGPCGPVLINVPVAEQAKQ